MKRTSTARVKVLVLIKGLGLGGAERLLVDSLPFLNRDQFEYHVAYLLPWKHFLVPELEAAGIPVHCLGGSTGRGTTGPAASRWSAITLLPNALRQLLALQRREQFQVIQADLPVAGILARLAGKWCSVPVVYTEHNLQERYFWLTRWANAATYHWNRRVLAVSREVAESIGRCGLGARDRVVTLLNGVPVEQIRAEASQGDEARRTLDIPSHHLVVGTVAVFRTQKRLHDWLRVAAAVLRQAPNVTFLLVGGGPLESELRSRVAELGLTRRVCMPGFRADGRCLIGAMDVFLMTSEFEGLPIALLEAMTLGKPVVSTRAGGIPEVLTHGETGLLTAIGDIDALTGNVLRLLGEGELRRRMGEAGAAKVETDYHVKRRVTAIEHLYDDIAREAA